MYCSVGHEWSRVHIRAIVIMLIVTLIGISTADYAECAGPACLLQLRYVWTPRRHHCGRFEAWWILKANYPVLDLVPCLAALATVSMDLCVCTT